MLLNEVLDAKALPFLPTENAQETGYDLIIAGFEINRRHGSGVLLLAIYKEEKNVAHICTCRLHGGVNELPTKEFFIGEKSREDVFREVEKVLSTIKIRSIMCVPCFLEEIWASLAAKEISGAPLCTYIMDDPSLYKDARIPVEVLGECIEKSDLCLAISKEMAIAYEEEFNKKFWILPPVVDLSELESHDEKQLHRTHYRQEHGALVGNIWAIDQRMYFYDLMLNSGIAVDWFCNGKANFSRAEIQEAYSHGINLCNPIHPTKLAPILQNKPFVLVPSGTTSQQGLLYPFDSVVKFSIPSRIPFIAAASGVPIIVLSNDPAGSAAASFVQETGIGFVSSYRSRDFRKTVEMAMDPERRKQVFAAARALTETLSSEKTYDWILRSLEARQAIDERYESLMAYREESVLV